MEELLFYNMNMLLYQKAGDSSTPQRHVTNFEIEYQLCDGGISHIDGQDYPIKEGQLLLAKPGMTRNTTGVYHCLAIHFSCRDESLSAKLKGLPTLLTSPYSGRVKKLLTNAYNAQSGSETHTLRLEGILLQIIAEYMDAGQITHNIPLKYQRYAPGIFQTVDYMNKHFPEHITCDQLASQMFISTNFYQKLFREIMKVSPAKHLREIRIAEACRLLANTDLSVQEIAEQCGFNCSSYFIYVLRKEQGITPFEYRKRNRILL
jgi:AraC-like DNA-binding protein